MRRRLDGTNSNLPDWVGRPLRNPPDILPRKRVRLWDILVAAFGEPAHIDRRPVVIRGRRHDVIALLDELRPLDPFGRSDALNMRSHQFSSRAPPSVNIAPVAHPIEDPGEYLVVRFRLAQRLDALVLHHHHAVIESGSCCAGCSRRIGQLG